MLRVARGSEGSSGDPQPATTSARMKTADRNVAPPVVCPLGARAPQDGTSLGLYLEKGVNGLTGAAKHLHDQMPRLNRSCWLLRSRCV